VSTLHGQAADGPIPLRPLPGRHGASGADLRRPGRRPAPVRHPVPSSRPIQAATTPGTRTRRPAYYWSLKDRYRAIQAIFHQRAPNARVSLSWGGWQAAGTTAPSGPGGRRSGTSPTCCGAPTSRASRPWRPTATPATSGPWSGSSGLRARHARPLQARQRLRRRVRGRRPHHVHRPPSGRGDPAGLFAMSFMDGTSLAASSELHGLVRAAVRRYARP
jgi:hypothetical protein